MTKMNEAIKNQWVATLRSGKFPQGRGALAKADDNTHCCLGVLCEIVPGVEKVEREDLSGISIFKLEGDEDSMYLPESVSNAAGLNGSGNPIILLPTGSTSLANLNDEGFTFKQIADIIDYFL